MDLHVDLGTIASTTGAIAVGVIGYLAKRAIDRHDDEAAAERKLRAQHDAERSAQLAGLETAMLTGNAAVLRDLTDLRSEFRSTAQLVARRLDEHDARLGNALASAENQGARIGHIERDVAVLADRDRRRSSAEKVPTPRPGIVR